jgi:hypothetical protein
VKLLYYKPCFGEMKYNFPNKRFKVVPYGQDTLKVYVPLTNLISTNNLDIFLYQKVRYIVYLFLIIHYFKYCILLILFL